MVAPGNPTPVSAELILLCLELTVRDSPFTRPSGAQNRSSMKIPEWLSHLRTDSYGRPVPFVNRWGPQDPARMSIAHDRWVGGGAGVLRGRLGRN